MPELPEVETIRRQLEREVVGKRVKNAEVAGMRSIRRHPNKKHFASKLAEVKLASLKRRGKYLVFTLDSEEVLVVHLGMSGQLLKATAKDTKPKHTHVELHFTQGGMLRFVDPRTFGEMFVTTPDELTNDVPELATLGLDPVESPITWTQFAQLVLGRSMKLKSLLMDQSILAGIGNIYSDEILYDAGLRFDRLSDSLSVQEVRRLARSVVEILHDAIKHGGSSLADEQYVDVHGNLGGYQAFHRVYARDGQPCVRCRGEISKTKFSGRTTYFCAQCQT